MLNLGGDLCIMYIEDRRSASLTSQLVGFTLAYTNCLQPTQTKLPPKLRVYLAITLLVLHVAIVLQMYDATTKMTLNRKV